jgi:tetratricopeptide (TPR) repeat protein
MLDCHRLVQARLAAPDWPEVGENLGDFQLLAELGRGTGGRVFLAAQPALADRAVVLKVTARQDREFLFLARLQHTHIIPLYGVHDFPGRGLRALSQPYLGGTTLAHLLDLLGDVPAGQRTGRSLVEALDHAGRSLPAPLPGRGGPREALAGAPYAEALCWIGACLAEALQHAHERGLVHLDLKPSNLLLAADGQPLLLDFHLALHPVQVGQTAPEGMGGTPQYMSPEQRAAYSAARSGLPVPAGVDQRSDVYSLGRLLYTALGGEEKAGEVVPLHRCNRRVSVGLSDVIGRCLAPHPGDRYPDAAALAADLRRHLAAQPLRGVPNRSLRERWRKWRRRRPAALLWAAALLALAAVPAILGTAGLECLGDARRALREGEAQMERGAFTEAERTLARGKAQVEGWPGCHRLVAQIEGCQRRAQRAVAAERLHDVTERLRLLAGIETLSSSDLGTLDVQCRKAWEARHLVLGEEGAGDQARADLVDLALLWADLKRRLAPGNVTTRGEAREVLAEAEALCGPSAALTRERRALDAKAETDPGPGARTFREHVALGRSLLGAGALARAAEELERAVDLRPQDFWAHFYSAVCAYRRGRHADAVHSFGVVLALAPENALVYHNRALALAGCGNPAAALRDCDRALALAPTLGPAALNRGVLHYQQGRHAEALTDLERALRLGADPAATHYNLALVHLARGERAAALGSVTQALHHDPSHAQAQRLRERLLSEE